MELVKNFILRSVRILVLYSIIMYIIKNTMLTTLSYERIFFGGIMAVAFTLFTVLSEGE